MHVIFLNPQGNFDNKDSYWTEHPDFGGQLVYVKEICLAMADMGVKVDIITRQIDDPEWPEFSKQIECYRGHEQNPRIVRIPCGGPRFLNKERLWEHLDEFTDNVLSFYGEELPDFATGHYGDGGYCCVLLKNKAGINFTFTGHSLGAQKLDKLGMKIDNYDEMESQFHFSKRIIAERLSMTHSFNIFTSTAQERMEQYSHQLYKNAVNVDDDSKFSVVPPGATIRIFNTRDSGDEGSVYELLDKKLKDKNKPYVIVSSRLDEKKNIIGVVNAYAMSKELQERANLGIFLRGIDDPFTDINNLPEIEQQILKPILDIITDNNLKENVDFIDVRSQKELATTYRYFAKKGSVFALTAFYEPFGLAPIEAAACGLAVVATKNGGPSEIFEDGSGVLVAPFDDKDISAGLLMGIKEYEFFSKRGIRRVKDKYTWKKAAEAYLSVIKRGASEPRDKGPELPALSGDDLLTEYLKSK